MYEVIGRVSRVLGPVVHAKGVTMAQMLELVEVGEERLVGEIVRLEGDSVAIQVYEDTTGLAPGAAVYGSGMPRQVPTRRAVRIMGWSAGISFRLPATSSSGTGTQWPEL